MVFVKLDEGDMPEYANDVVEFRPGAGDMLIWCVFYMYIYSFIFYIYTYIFIYMYVYYMIRTMILWSSVHVVEVNKTTRCRVGVVSHNSTTWSWSCVLQCDGVGVVCCSVMEFGVSTTCSLYNMESTTCCRVGVVSHNSTTAPALATCSSGACFTYT